MNKIKDKDVWDKNLLLAYKYFFKKLNGLNVSSFSAYEKILTLCKDNYSAYEIRKFVNQVFPLPSDIICQGLIDNKITDILRKNNVLNGFEEYLLNNGISDYNSFCKELADLEAIFLEKGLSVSDLKNIYKMNDDKPIKVERYNLFFHGTPKENFSNIKNDGYLIYQKYEPNVHYRYFSQILEHDKNKLYLSNVFEDSIYYALRKSLDGYVFVINMEDCVIHNSPVSTHHFWTTEKIFRDRFIKIYHVYVENNQIMISECEGMAS